MRLPARYLSDSVFTERTKLISDFFGKDCDKLGELLEWATTVTTKSPDKKYIAIQDMEIAQAIVRLGGIELTHRFKHEKWIDSYSWIRTNITEKIDKGEFPNG